ncbi:MAG: hypothetical protein K5879_00475 [Lachnospiraceae bacterium]|nr:hypothetical protein [Lachnospiraceae bacterium]
MKLFISGYDKFRVTQDVEYAEIIVDDTKNQISTPNEIYSVRVWFCNHEHLDFDFLEYEDDAKTYRYEIAQGFLNRIEKAVLSGKDILYISWPCEYYACITITENQVIGILDNFFDDSFLRESRDAVLETIPKKVKNFTLYVHNSSGINEYRNVHDIKVEHPSKGEFIFRIYHGNINHDDLYVYDFYHETDEEMFNSLTAFVSDIKKLMEQGKEKYHIRYTNYQVYSIYEDNEYIL